MNTLPTFPEVRTQITELLAAQGYDNVELTINDIGEAEVIFSVPVRERELPEVLQPFETDQDVERAIHKGVTQARTYEGARFELALTEYASHLHRELLDSRGIQSPDCTSDDPDSWDVWKTASSEMWTEVCEREDVRELRRILDEDYV